MTEDRWPKSGFTLHFAILHFAFPSSVIGHPSATRGGWMPAGRRIVEPVRVGHPIEESEESGIEGCFEYLLVGPAREPQPLHLRIGYVRRCEREHLDVFEERSVLRGY